MSDIMLERDKFIIGLKDRMSMFDIHLLSSIRFEPRLFIEWWMNMIIDRCERNLRDRRNVIVTKTNKLVWFCLFAIIFLIYSSLAITKD